MFAFSFHDRPTFSRRRALQMSAGAMLSSWATRVSGSPNEKQQPPGFAKAKSVLMIYASGGQSQLEMWDPKPNAPREVRGDFRAIATRAPGVFFGEHMPKLASCADRFTVVRSMAHQDTDHGSATYLALTGRYHQRISSNPDPRPSDYPTLGSILNVLPGESRFPYKAVHVNAPALVPRKPSPGQNGGLLGKAANPLVVGDVTRGDVAIPGIYGADGLDIPLLRQRLALKRRLDAETQALAQTNNVAEVAPLWDKALDFLAAPKVRDAFRLSREPDRVREAYGKHRAGQACLLARRLVEAEAPFVNVIWSHSNRGQDDSPDDPCEYGWDTHNDIFSSLRNHLLPRFDATVSVLIDDLTQRGLMDQTLLVCMGEFGRAPKVAKEPGFKGNEPGRKHWASAYSIMMAGAGVAEGGLVGETDRWGGDVLSERYGPWDVAATIFHALGISPEDHFHDPLGRPFPIADGKPISAIYR